MKINVAETSKELGKNAGREAAALIRRIISEKGRANIILATGTSQFETISKLISENYIDWTKVTMFHLDEYIGLPVTHEASFRKYLKERFLEKISAAPAYFLIDGETNPEDEINRLNTAISEHPIDVALVGIGENGHLAFNDPPADFETNDPYLIVNLDEPCRLQQLNEGWFATLGEVPTQAISMSVEQIMKSGHIICSVPDLRKAQAVRDSLEEEVCNLYPASILQLHANCTFFLDKNSASLVSDRNLETKRSF
jgi:glucosamine-6-phosphate deaminase